MTSNQLAYWTLQETKRANAAKEAETERSNKAKEAETHRSNLEQEQYGLLKAINNPYSTIMYVMNDLGITPEEVWKMLTKQGNAILPNLDMEADLPAATAGTTSGGSSFVSGIWADPSLKPNSGIE